MSQLFITSDYHFNHKNIIKYCNRPFKSVEDMNKTIIDNYNGMVKPDDLCYNLGDIVFTGGIQAGKDKYLYFINQLNGRHFVIKGNHDRKNGVTDAIQSAIMYKCGLKTLLVHDPINANTNNNMVLCGHVHNGWKFAELHEKGKVSLLINCGVDVWGYKPIPFTKLFECYEQWKVGKITPIIYDKKEVIKFREERKIKKNREGEIRG